MTVLRDEATFDGVCSLSAAVQTTGYMGGDTGHGCRSEVVLVNHGGCDLHVEIEGPYTIRPDKIVIKVGGDAELDVLADALEWAGRRLRELAQNETK